jgi:hypothetical protein
MTFSHLARIEHADERETHIRVVQQFGHSLPEGSCSKRNRDARETHIAARRRAVEQAYQLAIERDTAYVSPENVFSRMRGAR